MSTETNKQLVGAFLERCSENDFDAALGMMTEDSTYWIAGHPEEHPGSGTISKEQYRTLIQGLSTNFPDGMRIRPLAYTAEGDRVAVEAESVAVTAKGRPYSQQYHYLFEIADGKIHAIRMYLDTLHVVRSLA